MKNFKKIASAIAALSLAACVAVPMSATVFTASAYDVTITDSGNEDGTHVYEAYQIFQGTIEESTHVLSNIDWGSGVKFDGTDKTQASLYEKLAAKGIKVVTKTKESGFADAFATWQAEGDNSGKTEDDFLATFDKTSENVVTVTESDPASAKDVADALSGLEDDDPKAQDFADIIAGYLADTPTAKNDTASAGNVTLSDLPAGYYLIQDAADSPSGEPASDKKNNGAKTRYILWVTTDEDVTAKSSAPSVVKKVQENTNITDDYKENGETDDNYNDVADYNIGDAVPFRLYGTMPDTLTDYDHYYYKFTDTLGTQFDTPLNTAIKVEIDGTDVTNNANITANSGTITVEFTDILNLGVAGLNVTKDSVVTVSYSATLNSSANIGLPGQENEVYLEYSNNPNSEGTGSSDKGKTPTDKVIVFTYELDVTKYLDDTSHTAGTDENKKAGFKLQRADGKYAKFGNDGKITGWDDETNAGEIYTNATGQFSFIGLDDGTYTLIESHVPAGYNKMENLTLIVDAETKNNQTWDGVPKNALTKLDLYEGTKDESPEDTDSGETDGSRGKVDTSIINQKGATLPSTGGIGTTLFYLGGGALVAVAGVMLITKKRMTKE